jgi:prepilin-type processing-associated H-X9-DG protein
MIRIQCPACNTVLKASQHGAGRKISCPQCGQRLLIPNPVQPVNRAVLGEVIPSSAHSPAEATAGPAVTSGKATISLVLGVLSFFALLLAGIPAAVLGFLALGDIKKGGGRVKGQGLAITGIILGLMNTLATCLTLPMVLAILLPAVQKAHEAATVRDAETASMRDASARVQSQNNLKQIGLAMHMYFGSQLGRVPPAASCGPEGKPLLSWRVALLPYLGEEGLYRQFRLNEPWDSPHNQVLLPLMPKVYLLPGEQPGPDGLTHYQVFVGPGTAFEDRPKAVNFPADFPDGSSNTLWVVEAANGVPWTRPDDLPFNPNGPLPPLSDRFRSGCNVLYVDGSVRPLPADTPERTVKALITRNGNELVTPP